MKKRIIIMVVFVYVTFTGWAFASEEDAQSKVNNNSAEVDSVFYFLPEDVRLHDCNGGKVWCFLPRDMYIQDVLCRGGGSDWQTGFYKRNGNLAWAWLAQDETIDGIPCMKASFWTEVSMYFGGNSSVVMFYDNGKLSRCKLSEDVTIEGRLFEKGDVVSFDKSGGLHDTCD